MPSAARIALLVNITCLLCMGMKLGKTTLPEDAFDLGMDCGNVNPEPAAPRLAAGNADKARLVERPRGSRSLDIGRQLAGTIECDVVSRRQRRTNARGDAALERVHR